MKNIPDWLYKTANITRDETKKLELELLRYLKNWCIQNNTTISKLESQFIFQPTKIDYFEKNSTLYQVLSRMKIDSLFAYIGFIIVTENKYFPIHIDYYNTDFMSIGLNIPVLNCNGSRTVWYDSIPEDNDDMPDYIGELTKVSVSVSVKCVQDNVKEIGFCDATVPSWINNAIPHAPRCNHNKLRINCSLRFNPKINDLLRDGTFDKLLFK